MTSRLAQQLIDNFPAVFPHNADFNMQLEHCADGLATLYVPFQEFFVADTENGLLHTSVMATAADSATGLAVISALPEMAAIATLDLHVDYLKPALRDKTLWVKAECYRMTDNVAFARGHIWQDDETNPIAHITASFMRDTMSQRSKNSATEANTGE